MNKIISKQEFRQIIRPELKKNGKSIVLCHGVFDLVHPGHLIHFKEAKKMGDVLVVSITASKYVRKGPGRPCFDDETRLDFLSELGSIDYILLSECFTVDDIIEAVRPDIYVKGSEYKNEDKDLTGKIKEERLLVEKYGGCLRYTEGAVFSSTKFINTSLSGLPDDVKQYMQTFISHYNISTIKEYADKAKKIKALVIGDFIVDRYTYCQVHGLISKDAVYSSRLQKSEDYLGGVLAIARHLSGFVKEVKVVSAYGGEKEIRENLEKNTPDNLQLNMIKSQDRDTIIKHKYLMQNSRREEYRKVFAIHNIPQYPTYEEACKDKFYRAVEDTILDYDVVFLADFGHGLIDKKVMDYIQDNAKYLVLNVQTNSSNMGMNIITKYQRADAFSIDQKELALACPDKNGDEELALAELVDRFNAVGWLTRGADGAMLKTKNQSIKCPAFTLKVKDTIGAGDAFYSIAGLFLAVGAEPEVSLFMGNIAGALGANIVGNKESLEAVNVLKYASTLMNI